MENFEEFEKFEAAETQETALTAEEALTEESVAAEEEKKSSTKIGFALGITALSLVAVAVFFGIAFFMLSTIASILAVIPYIGWIPSLVFYGLATVSRIVYDVGMLSAFVLSLVGLIKGIKYLSKSEGKKVFGILAVVFSSVALFISGIVVLIFLIRLMWVILAAIAVILMVLVVAVIAIIMLAFYLILFLALLIFGGAV